MKIKHKSNNTFHEVDFNKEDVKLFEKTYIFNSSTNGDDAFSDKIEIRYKYIICSICDEKIILKVFNDDTKRLLNGEIKITDDGNLIV